MLRIRHGVYDQFNANEDDIAEAKRYMPLLETMKPNLGVYGGSTYSFDALILNGGIANLILDARSTTS